MANDEIMPENVRSAAVVYAAAQFEQMRLFDVVDRIVESFLNGLLPTGNDSTGRALYKYYRSRSERMTTAERRALFSRVIGLPGGEGGNDVRPNSEFSDLWLRFVASVAEYSRQRSVEPILGGGIASLNEVREVVRKSGRDLAANLSLHGYGYTVFAARRLKQDVRDAQSVLKLPQVLKAYGASSAYQVIERVTSIDLGGTASIPRYRTMAETGVKILGILAAHSFAWAGKSGRPLFSDGATAIRKNRPDIPDRDRDDLTRAVEKWLAVNGAGPERPRING
jgi:hypothetical protein